MAVRKGQFIVNFLNFTLKIPPKRRLGYLFSMSDEEFEEMEHEYRKSIIPFIHDPDEWTGEQRDVGRMFYEDYRKSGEKMAKKLATSKRRSRKKSAS